MLLPARARPKNLKTSVESVFDLAARPGEVEIIVCLDDDDPHLQEELGILRGQKNVEVFTGHRRGYAKMHVYYDWCAANAKGDWLFLWNDDIEMRSVHWDLLLYEAPPFSVQWPRRDITKTTDFTLPVIGRGIYDAVGHLSQNAFCDAWIADFSSFAGTSVIRDDIEFTHHRLNDETLQGQQDGGVEWGKFSEEQQLAMRMADYSAIVSASGHASRFDGWKTEEVVLSLDYLRLGKRPVAYKLLGRVDEAEQERQEDAYWSARADAVKAEGGSFVSLNDLMKRPVISILIPTRDRPKNLRASILSCLELANHPSRLEILVGLDEDDPQLAANLAVSEAFGPMAKAFISDKRFGYAGLHHYFNKLASESTGSILVNWNDDTEFVTNGWDDLLCDAPPVAVQFLRRSGLRDADPTFPATSRNIYEAMGHLSQNGHCDAWISDVSWWARCQIIRNDIEFRHHCLADQTAKERVDDMPRFKGPEQTALRAKDIAAVKALVAGSEDAWTVWQALHGAQRRGCAL